MNGSSWYLKMPVLQSLSSRFLFALDMDDEPDNH